jgi:GNAT superfamily N-acetyltransferase
MQIILRNAQPADARPLASLRYEFRSSLLPATEEREKFVARCAAWMSARLSESNWHCWIAEFDGAIAGNLWCNLIEKVPNPVSEPELHAYLTNFFVRPTLRGGGIGESLLRAGLEWCRSHSVDAVILWPTERSRSLYRRHGFAAAEDVLKAVLS